MKAFKLLVLFIVFGVVSSYAGPDKTIIEKIEDAITIEVYFYEGYISVKQPDPSPTVAMAADEIEACKTKIPQTVIPEGYAANYQKIVDELNKVFSTDKFKLGDIEAIPKKTITVFGSEDEVPDWQKLENKFVVVCSPSVKYYGFTYSRADDVLKVETWLEASIITYFCNIIEKEAPLKYINAMGVNSRVKGEKFFQEGCATEIEKFYEYADPASLVEPLGEAIPGSFNKFYEKQKKKYDKAMKKKKK